MIIRNRKAFSLTEILVALSVLAFALVPLMGVMWSGVRRTDVSNTYANASQIAASVLEYILNDSVRFSQLNFTNPAAPSLRDSDDSKESYGITTTVLGVNDFLGDRCWDSGVDTEAQCTKAMSKKRFFKIGRNNFYTDLYLGAYFINVPGAPGGKQTNLSYKYLVNPAIDYEVIVDNPQLFYDTAILSNRNYGDVGYSYEFFSPYLASDDTVGFSRWSPDPSRHNMDTSKTDQTLSLPFDNADVAFTDVGGSVLGNPRFAEYSNFAKVQLFIRWGYEFVSEKLETVSGSSGSYSKDKAVGMVDSRGKAKMIELVTFKGRFQ